MNILDNIKQTYKNGNMVIRLIYVNSAVFLFFSLLSVFFYLFRLDQISVAHWFSAPSNLQSLLRHFWTPITYMFYHEHFFHILFNMLVLFWFGRFFLMYFSEKQLLAVYVFGGLLGALLYILAYNLLPVYTMPRANGFVPVDSSILMGASGSIMAIILASAVRAPKMEMHLLFIGRIKLMWIAIIVVLVSLFGLRSANSGGELAHLGGALGGYLFVVFERKGIDITRFINSIIDFFVNIFKPRPKVKSTKYHAQKMSPEEYNQKKAQDEKEIDRILDKIKTSGYESLTVDEKKKLFEQKR